MGRIALGVLAGRIAAAAASVAALRERQEAAGRRSQLAALSAAELGALYREPIEPDPAFRAWMATQKPAALAAYCRNMDS